MEEDQGGKRRRQKRKQEAETDEHKDGSKRKREGGRDIRDWEGKSACANLWPVTYHLSRVKNDRGGATVETTM